jgi:hypothetical protein
MIITLINLIFRFRLTTIRRLFCHYQNASCIYLINGQIIISASKRAMIHDFRRRHHQQTSHEAYYSILFTYYPIIHTLHQQRFKMPRDHIILNNNYLLDFNDLI